MPTLGGGTLAVLALFSGAALGMVSALGVGWFTWGRRRRPPMAAAGLPEAPPWPAALPPPRVGRQLWRVPDRAARREVVAAAMPAWSVGGALLVPCAADRAPLREALAGALGVFRPVEEEPFPDEVLATAQRLNGAAVVVSGAMEDLDELLADARLPVLVVLAEGEGDSAAAGVTLERVEGGLAIGGEVVIRGGELVLTGGSNS